MIALAIVIVVLVLLALLRIGVTVVYSADGLILVAHAGFISVRIMPRVTKWEKREKKNEKKRQKKEKKAEKSKRAKKEKRKKEEAPEEKPGGLKGFAETVSIVKNTLGRLRRRLLIKELTIHFTASSDDPTKAIKTFGVVNAAISVLVPLLERVFRIKRRDIRAAADFSVSEPSVYAKASISLAIWEVIYIALAILPLIMKTLSKNTNRKGGQDNGKSSDQ